MVVYGPLNNVDVGGRKGEDRVYAFMGCICVCFVSLSLSRYRQTNNSDTIVFILNV